MALKSESASQMDHLQALEKVSPKLTSREDRYRSVSSFVYTSLTCLKISFQFHFCLYLGQKIIMKQCKDQTPVVKKVDSIDYE